VAGPELAGHRPRQRGLRAAGEGLAGGHEADEGADGGAGGGPGGGGGRAGLGGSGAFDGDGLRPRRAPGAAKRRGCVDARGGGPCGGAVGGRGEAVPRRGHGPGGGGRDPDAQVLRLRGDGGERERGAGRLCAGGLLWPRRQPLPLSLSPRPGFRPPFCRRRRPERRCGGCGPPTARRP
jgi:hypothetical protein